MMLDARNVHIDTPEVYVGSVHTSHVRIGELLGDALRVKASAIVLVHNHPSGDPAPSAADVQMTKQLYEACRLMDIDLFDHVIIARRAVRQHEALRLGLPAGVSGDASRLIALDLDGTLLTRGNTVSEGNAAAVREAVAAGVHIVFATSRWYTLAKRTADVLGVTSPIICHNGAMIRDPVDGAKLLQLDVPAGAAVEIAALADDGGYESMATVDDVTHLLTKRPEIDPARLPPGMVLTRAALGPRRAAAARRSSSSGRTPSTACARRLGDRVRRRAQPRLGLQPDLPAVPEHRPRRRRQGPRAGDGLRARRRAAGRGDGDRRRGAGPRDDAHRRRRHGDGQRARRREGAGGRRRPRATPTTASPGRSASTRCRASTQGRWASTASA